MSIVHLTCVECPMGCAIEAKVENGRAVEVTGNTCPRGKLYAENEVICPKRVLTSTVRCTDGRMLPVKTDRPVKKSDLLDLTEKLKGIHPVAPVSIGEVLAEGFSDDANLISADDLK